MKDKGASIVHDGTINVTTVSNSADNAQHLDLQPVREHLHLDIHTISNGRQ